jgi:hypothetical protein
MAKTQKPDLDEATLQIAKRILSTPPKPHSEMKLGKGRPILNKKSKESKTRPASKGRVHKGKTHS